MPEKRTVSFLEPARQSNQNVEKQIDKMDGDRKEIEGKIDRLKKHADQVETRIPLMSYKAADDQDQLKNFIITYYKPILNSYELGTLLSTTAF